MLIANPLSLTKISKRPIKNLTNSKIKSINKITIKVLMGIKIKINNNTSHLNINTNRIFLIAIITVKTILNKEIISKTKMHIP